MNGIYTGVKKEHFRIKILKTALSFAQENDFETTDLAEIARKMCLLPKVNSNKPRVVVITQVKNVV